MSRPVSHDRECYFAVAEERSGPEMSMRDLDIQTVSSAKAYAKRNHKRWPPKPITTGWQVQVWSW